MDLLNLHNSIVGAGVPDCPPIGICFVKPQSIYRRAGGSLPPKCWWSHHDGDGIYRYRNLVDMYLFAPPNHKLPL